MKSNLERWGYDNLIECFNFKCVTGRRYNWTPLELDAVTTEKNYNLRWKLAEIYYSYLLYYITYEVVCSRK